MEQKDEDRLYFSAEGEQCHSTCAEFGSELSGGMRPITPSSEDDETLNATDETPIQRTFNPFLLEEEWTCLHEGVSFFRKKIPGCRNAYLWVKAEDNVSHSDKSLVLYDFLDGHRRPFLRLFPPVLARQFSINGTQYRERVPRRISWDELFIDLVFVSIIDRLSKTLEAAQFSPSSILQFVLVFMAIHHTWANLTGLFNRFGSDSVQHRLVILSLIIMVYGMAFNSEHAFGVGLFDTTNVFIITYMLFRAIVALYFCAAMFAMPKFIYSLSLLSVGQSIGIVPMMLSLLVNKEYQIALSFVTILVDYTSFWWMAALYRKLEKNNDGHRVQINAAHNFERMANKTLIMLGEIVVALLWSNSDPAFSPAYLVSVLGLLVPIYFQWITFDLDDSPESPVNSSPGSIYIRVLWYLLHCPFHMSLVACGSAMSALVGLSRGLEYGKDLSLTSSPDTIAPQFTRWIFCFGLALALTLRTLLTWLYVHAPRDWMSRFRYRLLVRFLAVIGLILIGVLGDGWYAMTLITAISGLLIGVLIVEVGSRYRQRRRTRPLRVKGTSL